MVTSSRGAPHNIIDPMRKKRKVNSTGTVEVSRNVSVQEVRCKLARLLASENLHVYHSDTVDTAQFDVSERTLVLPEWDVSEESIYNLLVAHEVGHALYTPDIEALGLDPNQVNFDALNVIEDVRIEKLIKRKYPGLSRVFREGYVALQNDDMFSIKGIDINSLNFIDRLNIHFKVSVYNPGFVINFSDEELAFVKMIEEANTFEDVLDIYMKMKVSPPQTPAQQKSNKKKSGKSKKASGYASASGSGSGSGSMEDSNENSDDESDEDSEDSEGSGDESDENSGDSDGDSKGSGDGDKDEDGSGDESESDSDSNSDGGSSGAGSGAGSNVDMNPQTQKNFDKGIQKTVKKRSGNNTFTYVSVDYTKYKSQYLIVGRSRTKKSFFDSSSDSAKKSLREFLIKDRPVVSHMIQKFQQKKAAMEYNKILMNKTGVIDTNKMHTYKYCDDIFRRNSVTPTGKNHGLILFLDLSGSMAGIIGPTLQHIIRISVFCRKLGIPFQVFGFSDASSVTTKTNSPEYKSSILSTPGKNIIMPSFGGMLELLSSDMNSVEYDTYMSSMWATYCSTGPSRSYLSSYSNNVNNLLSLSGTPLDIAVLASINIHNEFVYRNRIDKAAVVFMTDGESNNSYVEQKNTGGRGSYLSNSSSILVDPATGYRNRINSASATHSLVEYAKAMTGSPYVSFRLSGSSVPKSVFNTLNRDTQVSRISEYNSMISSNGFVELKDESYDSNFIINANSSGFRINSSGSTTFDNDIGQTNKLNKTILSKFIDLVA